MPSYTLVAHTHTDKVPDSTNVVERLFGRHIETPIARRDVRLEDLQAFVAALGRPQGEYGYRVEATAAAQFPDHGPIPDGAWLTVHSDDPDSILRYERFEAKNGYDAGPRGTVRLLLAYQPSGLLVDGKPYDTTPRWVLHFGAGYWSYYVDDHFLALMCKVRDHPEGSFLLDMGASMGFNRHGAAQVLRFLANHGFGIPQTVTAC